MDDKEKDKDQPKKDIVVEEKEVVPYKKQYIAADDLELNVREVVQVGINGEKVVTKINGVIAKEEVRKEAETEIIKVGTKPKIEKRELDFSVEKIEDDTLPKGTEIIETNGVKGVEETRTEYFVDSQTGEVTSTTTTKTIAPTNQVVRVGKQEKEKPAEQSNKNQFQTF